MSHCSTTVEVLWVRHPEKFGGGSFMLVLVHWNKNKRIWGS